MTEEEKVTIWCYHTIWLKREQLVVKRNEVDREREQWWSLARNQINEDEKSADPQPEHTQTKRRKAERTTSYLLRLLWLY